MIGLSGTCSLPPLKVIGLPPCGSGTPLYEDLMLPPRNSCHYANLLNYHRSRAGANAVTGITDCRDEKPEFTTEARRRGENKEASSVPPLCSFVSSVVLSCIPLKA